MRVCVLQISPGISNAVADGMGREGKGWVVDGVGDGDGDGLV